MKIAMVFDGLQTGGIERVGADYSRLLIELGYDVTIYNLQPKLNNMEGEFPNDCKVVHLNYPRKFAPEQYAQLVKRGLWGKFVYPAACIVLGIANQFYKVISRIKYREIYDIVIAFSGHFNDLTFVANNCLKSVHKMCWLHGALYGYILISDGFLNLYKRIKNLIVLVDDAQEEALTTNKDAKLNIWKLYNPIFIKDRDEDKDEINRIKEKYGKFAVMVSRFEYPHKDHYTVAKAIDIVRTQYDEDINLVFLGEGPEEDRVKQFVNTECSSKDHIYFLGNHSDVQNYYQAAYMLVHASVAGEGLPTIMLEALAYELPMVVTDSKVGPREILGESEDGLLCKIKDPADMASKIVDLCRNHELYKNFQEKSKTRLKDFEPETIKDQLKNVLNQIQSQE